MIFSAFVYLAAYVLATLVAVLPEGEGFPDEVTAAFSTMAGYVQILDTLLPLSTLAAVLTILVAADLAVFAFKSLKWLISHIPLVGGRG